MVDVRRHGQEKQKRFLGDVYMHLLRACRRRESVSNNLLCSAPAEDANRSGTSTTSSPLKTRRAKRYYDVRLQKLGTSERKGRSRRCQTEFNQVQTGSWLGGFQFHSRRGWSASRIRGTTSAFVRSVHLPQLLEVL